MVMSESEIVREYRAAKNKSKQIEVLAELNAVKADWIKDILLRNPESGYVKPGPKPKQKAAESEAVREVNALAPEAPGRADRDRGGAALLLMELAAYVEERGFFYPPDPGEKSATIGGNISTNAGGMRAVKYGVTRDYVRALEVVLPSGEILTLGGETVKNSSGLSLKDLVVGSEGTLCVITKATLKLLALPPRTVSLLVPFPSLRQAIETVPAIVRSKAAPQAIEFMEREVILDAENYLGKRFPDHSAPAYLLLRFDGNTLAAIEEAYDDVAKLCLERGALDVLISDTQERDESIWTARGAFLEAIKGSTTFMDEVDCVVPRSRIHEMVDYLHTLEKDAGLRIKSFGHAGDGNLHTYLLKDGLSQEEWEKRMADTMAKIYRKAQELGGQVSGEHGIGYAKRAYLRESLPPAALALMQGIKRAFDPKGILNPHKVFEP